MKEAMMIMEKMAPYRVQVTKQSIREDLRMMILVVTSDVGAERDICHILLCTLILRQNIMARLQRVRILHNSRLEEVVEGQGK